MDFFDKIGKTASEAYKATADMTTKLARDTKIRIKISDLKSKVEDEYQKIGEKIYIAASEEDKKTVNMAKDLNEEIENIKKYKETIQKLEDESLELNDKKVCIKCKATIARDIKFCPECGAEQPKITEKKEEAKEVEILDDEKEKAEETSEEGAKSEVKEAKKEKEDKKA